MLVVVFGFDEPRRRGDRRQARSLAAVQAGRRGQGVVVLVEMGVVVQTAATVATSTPTTVPNPREDPLPVRRPAQGGQVRADRVD